MAWNDRVLGTDHCVDASWNRPYGLGEYVVFDDGEHRGNIIHWEENDMLLVQCDDGAYRRILPLDVIRTERSRDIGESEARSRYQEFLDLE